MAASPPSRPPGPTDPIVMAMFGDPRWKHLMAFADMDDDEAEQLNYRRDLTLQAAAAIYNIQSAELQGKALAKATWALVGATAVLVLATAVLVVVTVLHG